MKMKLACCATLLAGLLVAPALAGVVVSFNPQDSIVAQNDVFWVDVVANIPETEPIVGWGFDLSVVDPSIAIPTGNVLLGAGWFEAPPGGDGDPYAGLSFPAGQFGSAVTLVSIEFQALAASGSTALLLSDNNPTDLTEGFLIEPLPTDNFAQVTYMPGSIAIPEPASLLLLALGALVRRR